VVLQLLLNGLLVSFKYYLIVLGCSLLTKLCSVEVFGPQGINRFTTEILVQDNNLLGTNDVVRNLETDVACYKLPTYLHILN